MCKKLLCFICNDAVLQFSQTGYQTEGIGSRSIQSCFFDSENLTLVHRGGFDETKSVKMLISLNSSQRKTANKWIFHTPPLQYIQAISCGGYGLTSESPLYNITCVYREGVDFLSY